MVVIIAATIPHRVSSGARTDSEGRLGFYRMEKYARSKSPADLDATIEHHERAIALVDEAGVRHSLFLAAIPRGLRALKLRMTGMTSRRLRSSSMRLISALLMTRLKSSQSSITAVACRFEPTNSPIIQLP